MQSPQRTPSQQPQTARKSKQQSEKRADVRTTPIVLDARSLRHVSGAGDLPKKYW